MVAVRLQFVVIPSSSCHDDIGEFLRQLGRRALLVCVLGCAVLNVSATGIQKSRMCLGDGDNVGTHVACNGLDMAAHCGSVSYRHLTRIDVALGWPVNHRGQKISTIG